MPTIALPANNLAADAFARAGVAMLQRLANVAFTVDGQALVGQALHDPALPTIGGMAVQAATLRINTLTADLPVGAHVGSPAVIASGPWAGTYEVALLTDHDDLGHTALLLERA